MSRSQPGSVIVDQLRDRIVTGLYFGNWQPGERLPSIRDIADAESVDRKTAAAAYHRLEEEGLVRVRARSGVFLREERGNTVRASGPLQKLQRKWLKNAHDGARAVGLDTAGMLRLLEAVAEVERTPVPIVEADRATARTIATELRDCLGLDARPLTLNEVETHAIVEGAPFAITTPYHAAGVASRLRGRPIVMATLSLDILRELSERAGQGHVLVVVPSTWIGERVGAAIRQRAAAAAGRLTLATADDDLPALRKRADCVFVWPGCDEVLDRFEGDGCVRPVRLLSDATLDQVRTVVLDCALARAAQ